MDGGGDGREDGHCVGAFVAFWRGLATLGDCGGKALRAKDVGRASIDGGGDYGGGVVLFLIGLTGILGFLEKLEEEF
ncbi:hypothetical protein Tco_0150021 [Tanacetum coccineum]